MIQQYKSPFPYLRPHSSSQSLRGRLRPEDTKYGQLRWNRFGQTPTHMGVVVCASDPTFWRTVPVFGRFRILSFLLHSSWLERRLRSILCDLSFVIRTSTHLRTSLCKGPTFWEGEQGESHGSQTQLRGRMSLQVVEFGEDGERIPGGKLKYY